MSWSALVTPPAPRPPSPKHPPFTTKFFSTKSFGPGHLVGAGILAFGVVGITKFYLGRAREQSDRGRGISTPPDEARQLARVDNDRGQYGIKR